MSANLLSVNFFGSSENTVPVKDAGEVHIAQDRGQVLNHARFFRGSEPVPLEDALDLEEQGVLLLLLTALHHAPPGGVPVESDGNSPALLLGVAQDGMDWAESK